MAVSEGKPLEPEAEVALSPEDIKMPSWDEKALWEQKFRVWHSLLEKGCIAKRGQGGRFCGLGGHACFYTACPRRTFEEVSVFMKAAITQPEPSPDFVRQFKQNQVLVGKLQKQLNTTKKRVDELEQKEN